MHKIILFELNEVPLKILDYYRKMRPNSWIATNYAQLQKHQSYSENPGHLSPWNTWPTLHRGVTSDKHYISDFNQDMSRVDQEFPPIWKVLAENNVTVGMFGSLHSYPIPEKRENYSFYVPDVFASGCECIPEKVELFQDINLKLSRKSARNVDNSIPYGDALKLLGKINSIGLKPNTLMAVGGHLIKERIKPERTVRRRTYQSVLSFDVFFKLLKKNKPDFVTYFTNHVASSQHRYWAAVFPNEYEELKFDQEWISTYNNEILFTMDESDKMLRKLASFVDKNPEYKLILSSSMGQNAVESEPLETQLYITDHAKFFQNFGVGSDDFEVLPSMLPQFNYSVSAQKAADFKRKIESFTINGSSLEFRDLGSNRFSLDFGHQNLKTIELQIEGNPVVFDQSGLQNVEIEDKSNATAYHIPEGHLFIYHPSFKVSDLSENLIPTCEIFPTLLQNFGLKVPDYAASASKNLL